MEARTILGSILHGAYGDLYEQAVCLRHYALRHPEVELRLFAATASRLQAFRVLDLSFAASFELWTEIEKQPEIERFFQFQVLDAELNSDVLTKLPEKIQALFDRVRVQLPWTYLRRHGLIPASAEYQVGLSDYGREELRKVEAANRVDPSLWNRPTINFLWRYRGQGRGAISSFGQRSKQELVDAYSRIFRELIAHHDCHLLVCGMNIVTSEANRELTDNKFPEFGLDLPAERVTYMQGLSWPLELEIASRATVCCGHASGFTEALWIKRGRDMVLMDAPPHYLLKTAYHRMPLFGLNPLLVGKALLVRSEKSYLQQIEAILARKRLT